MSQKKQPPETADARRAAIPMRRKRKISLKAKIDAAIDARFKAELPGLVEREVQRKLAEFEPQSLKRARYEEMETSTSRFLQLKFTNQPSPKIFTMTKVKGENSDSLGLALVEPLTEQVVSSGPESSMKVELGLVDGEFLEAETGNWTLKYFQDNIVPPRKGRRPLLTGDVYLKLNKGIAEVGNVKITDNSSWLASRSFRLVARVANGYFNEMRIKEAITNAFVVNEGRLKLSEKHYPPHPKDPAWRLEGIAKNGVFDQRLTKNGIYTVEDFLKLLKESRNGLRDILKMPDNAWEATVKHAETCTLNGEMVTGPICNQQFNPGQDNTEVVKQQSVQVVYEQYEVVGCSSNAPITSFSCGIPNGDFLNDQQFGGPSLLQQQNVTLQHSGGGTSTSGDTFKDFAFFELPAAENGIFINDNWSKNMRFGDDFPHENMHFGDDFPLELEFLEENHFGSADGCLNMPTDSTTGKHKDNLKWSTIIAAMAFSVRIVAVR